VARKPSEGAAKRPRDGARQVFRPSGLNTQFAPPILRMMQDCGNGDEAFFPAVEDETGLEAEAPQFPLQTLGFRRHAREIREQAEYAIESRLISVRLVFPEGREALFVDVVQMPTRARR
jgi:hypothetical protein